MHPHFGGWSYNPKVLGWLNTILGCLIPMVGSWNPHLFVPYSTFALHHPQVLVKQHLFGWWIPFNQFNPHLGAYFNMFKAAWNSPSILIKLLCLFKPCSSLKFLGLRVPQLFPREANAQRAAERLARGVSLLCLRLHADPGHRRRRPGVAIAGGIAWKLGTSIEVLTNHS